MRSIELRQERAKLIEQAGALLSLAAGEDRDLTPEEEITFEKMHADADRKKKEIDRIERQEAAEAEMREVVALRTDNDTRVARDLGTDPAAIEEERRLDNEAFRSYLRGGWAGVAPEHQARARSRMVALRDLPLSDQQRAAQTVTTSGGGYLVPEGFMMELDVAMLAYGGMRGACRVVKTSTGNAMPWPTVNDTGNTGRLLGINTQITNTAVAFGSVTFNAYKYSSDSILVPSELTQDSAFPLDGYLKDMLAERVGRVTNAAFTTGDGSSKPAGIVTGAVDSSVAFDISEFATGALANYLDLVALEHSVDIAYRQRPKCGFMFHDTMYRDLKKTVDSNGRPILRPANESPGQFETIMGYPFTVNNDMANTGTATNKSILFGDMEKFIIRLVRPMVVVRLVERYADYDQIGFIGFERCDSGIVDAGTNPIKYGVMEA